MVLFASSFPSHHKSTVFETFPAPGFSEIVRPFLINQQLVRPFFDLGMKLPFIALFLEVGELFILGAVADDNRCDIYEPSPRP